MARSLLTAMDNSTGDTNTKVVGTSLTLILDANPDRVSVTIGMGGTADLFLWFGEPPAGATGLRYTFGAWPKTFNVQEHGGIIRRKIYAAVSAATETIHWLESLDTHRAQKTDQ